MRPDATAAARDRRQLLAVATALLLGRAGSLALAEAQPRVVEVVAKKFVYVPEEIRVNKGETVILQFTAPEVTMGFSLPDFGVRSDLVSGKVTRVELRPDKAGSFTFLCDVFCGSGHEDMNGTLIVSG